MRKSKTKGMNKGLIKILFLYKKSHHLCDDGFSIKRGLIKSI